VTRPDGFAVPDDDPRKGNCGLTALAVVTGRSFTEVRSILVAAFPKGPRWRGSTRHTERVHVLRTLEVPFRAWEPQGRVQVRSWARHAAKAGTTYMLRHAGHVCVYRDGWVIDQTGPKPVENYRHRRCYITNFVEILNDPTP
jgi:hypothetical protein